MTADTCSDGRFELIEEAKRRLLESTNIEDRPEELAVLDSILFRFWQMGWLDQLREDKGAGTLTAEQVRKCAKGVYFEGYSDGATHRVHGIEETDWQTIADKLNATLGAGTCRNIAELNREGASGYFFVCSECGLAVHASLGIRETNYPCSKPDGSTDLCTFNSNGRYEFERCPRCGRKISE